MRTDQRQDLFERDQKCHRIDATQPSQYDKPCQPIPVRTARQRCKGFHHRLILFPSTKSDQSKCWLAGDYPCLGFPALNTRNVNPRPFSNGSTLASTSSTG